MHHGGQSPVVIKVGSSTSMSPADGFPCLVSTTTVPLTVETINGIPMSLAKGRRAPSLYKITTAGPSKVIHRRGRLDVADPTSSPSPSSAATTGEARDDDVEEGDNAVDDGFQNVADSVDDSHDAGADGLEDRFDLYNKEVLVSALK
ncbi:MAG: hypothetical protein Q9223_002496 [Gallowayella weberi]